MARPTSSLDVLRNRVRRVQFTVGLGFLAIVIGTLVTSALKVRLLMRFSIDTQPGIFLFTSVLPMLWVLAALPVLAYGAARIIPLKPVPTALGAAATGEVFLLAIILVTGGLEALTGDPFATATHFVLLAVGVLLTAWAVKSSRLAVDELQAQASRAAEAKKGEYDEFAKEAERLAAKNEAKEKAPSAPADAAPASDQAPTGDASTNASASTQPSSTQAPSGAEGTNAPSTEPKPPNGSAG
ncbi:MAG: hypothetical protein ACJ790_07480 [Myxococcaceae bacterium]